jgi:hypothetical protein
MPTMNELQEVVADHNLIRSGSKTTVAIRIYSLRSLYLSEKERKMLEDFLHIPEQKKELRIRHQLPT